MKPRNRPLETKFHFAGFSFPKYLWNLPPTGIKKRMERYKNQITGDYQIAPTPNQSGTSFYLDSDFMPGLRWKWCDEVASSICHTGWYCDEYQDSKIRGLVFRLPHSRGFLSAWSMGESMASEMEPYIYETEREAAYAADEIAREAAEAERAFQEQEEAKREAEEQEQETNTLESALCSFA